MEITTSLINNVPGSARCKNCGMPVAGSSSAAPRSGTQSIERAIAVLECFAASDRSLGLSDIARTVGLTPSTTHRLLRALVAAGYVEQEPMSEHYRLGIGIAVLGQRAIEHSGYHLARPVLDRLSATTGESASLGIRRGDEVVVIERATSPAPLRFDHPPGAEIALYASAMGKVLLAFSRRSLDAEIAAINVFSQFTDRTITAPDDLLVELTTVKAQGYATNVEERHLGACGLAAPVRSTVGWAHAAVGLQGPSVRLTRDRLRELAPIVMSAAADVAALAIRF